MRNKNRNRERRAERQAEALLRQAAHDDLSIKEKLVKAAARPGRSRREHERLIAIVWLA